MPTESAKGKGPGEWGRRSGDEEEPLEKDRKGSNNQRSKKEIENAWIIGQG